MLHIAYVLRAAPVFASGRAEAVAPLKRSVTFGRPAIDALVKGSHVFMEALLLPEIPHQI
jgi:hypothetical protein